MCKVNVPAEDRDSRQPCLLLRDSVDSLWQGWFLWLALPPPQVVMYFKELVSMATSQCQKVRPVMSEWGVG